MARMNPKRRLAAAARKAIMAERNAAHPAIRSPKGLGTSVVHRDSLLGASHTVGFNGPDRGAGRTTEVLSRKGNIDKSRVDMAATSNFGKAMPARVLGYTAPKSKRFACRAPNEWYTNDEVLASADNPVLVKRGKGRFKRL